MAQKFDWMKTPVGLPELPYAKDALAPYISEETINYHYGKHHKTYHDTTLDLVKGTELEGATLEEIVDVASKDASMQKLYNNAAQAWNHNFYFGGFVPASESKMPAELEELLTEAFGSVEDFKKEFVTKGVGQFGSGWVWLVLDHGKLAIVSTANGVNPWKNDQFPVFVLDVWEHAYYIDYQNLRKKHLEEVLDHIVNWDNVLRLIKKYKAQ